MDDTQFLAFDSPLNQSTYIKVIGVGGGGNNAVNHMYRNGITGVDFIVANTDMKALDSSPVPNKLVLGHEGLGCGGRPERASKAAEEKEKEIKELFQPNTKMIFITAGMGGGTGTGAAPVIARFAKDIQLEVSDEDDPGKILVVAVVTTPFFFEGNRRIKQAQEGVEALKKYVDSILVINNEKLRGYGNLVLSDAFSMANDVLLTAVKGIAEIITLSALINIDFRDVYTVMENSGTALMGIGEGEGEDRGLKAVEQATTSVLLDDNDIAEAKNMLLYLSYSHDHEMTMDEINVVTEYLTNKSGTPDTNIIWGAGWDDSLDSKVKITLIATGFKAKEKREREVVTLKDDAPKPPQPAPPSGSTEPTVLPIGQHNPGAKQINLSGADDSALPQQPHSTAHSVNNPFNQFDVPQTPSNPAPTDHHVIPLDAEVSPRTYHPGAQQHTPTDDGIVLKKAGQATAEAVQTAPTSQPQPAPQRKVYPRPESAPAPQASNPNDLQARQREDRIRKMHDLLCNDINGPQLIEQMSPAELMDEEYLETIHSNTSEASRSSVKPNGSLSNNLYLYSGTD